MFEAEDFAVSVAAEGGWVEDDAVPGATGFGEAPEPFEGIAPAEEVGGGVEVVVEEIPFPPVEVGAGEVDAGGGGAMGGGGDAEGAGVGEEVEQALAGGGGGEALDEGLALGALVKEEALAVASGEVDFVVQAEFADGEGAGGRGAVEAAGGMFVLLVKLLPPN